MYRYNYTKTIKRFDVRAYLGKWYEVASIPTWFEEGCRGATAYYTLCKCKDAIYVKNTCYTGHECRPKRRVSRGIATIPNPCDPGKLHVEFPNSPYQDHNQCRTNYWIHDTDYCTYAIVGSPDKEYLWFLSRKPCISHKLYRHMLYKAECLGYDVSQLCVKPMITIV